MKQETINRNVKRLCDFLEEPVHLVTFDIPTARDLVDAYSRCLDIFGAPRYGLSFLIVPLDDYIEICDWLRSTPGLAVEPKYDYIRFEYNGYRFELKKEKTPTKKAGA